MKFTRNKVKENLQKGIPCVGIEFMSESLKFIEVVGYTGFDYIQFDMEHTPYTFHDIEQFVRTADSVGLTSFVRVAEASPSNIKRALETGAQGLLAPQVKNAAEVSKIVDSMYYAPKGSRGMCPIIRAAGYSEDSWEQYLDWSESELMFIPLIENQSALDDLRAICQVDGVDGIAVGAGDLGQSLGAGAAGLSSPIVREAVQKIQDVALKHDMPIWAMPNLSEDPFKSVHDLLQNGAKLITYDADILMFRRECERIKRGFEDTLKTSTTTSESVKTL